MRRWFDDDAEHVTVRFLEGPESEPLPPRDGYLRLWLVEGFLAKRVEWTEKFFPALQGGMSLKLRGSESTPFSAFSRPPGSWQAPGAQLDFPVTPLLPYNGGVVEIEAALYKAAVDGPLATAMDVVSGFATLMGPPLSTAAAIADKISDGFDNLLGSTGDRPELVVHYAMTSHGGGGNVLRPGHLAVVKPKVSGELEVRDGQLHHDGAQLTGVDFLLLRVECRRERDDWCLPELDALIRAAGAAYLEGDEERFQARAKEAVIRAYDSADLTPRDQLRVAKLVRQEIDAIRELGAAPGSERTIESIAAERLIDPDDPRLDEVTLDDLLDF
ncbi:hypothetical protein [Microbispora hainanensis]|uniref:Uncharacterized protein n=1 Tax=Microbispora hainanensis TaxID=568844 RepID=A0A544YSK0_9ACTN|nr:hypothetical protein [Microbispora hainanensis]TQS19753.1 hypothetical protein FLX08_18310 [Microbispora hainanensis]